LEAHVVTIERLTPEDELMLWPDEVWPQDIGALILMDDGGLPDGRGTFRIDRARQAVAGRLHLVPRFRQLLYVPPRGLGGPLWVDAHAFDIRRHVQELPVPAPGDEEQLLLAIEQLRRRRLDRSRPLWEMWFLTGLADGGVALFVRMHHCMADGMAGVASMASFLDLEPDTSPSPPEPWTPAPMPTEAALLEDSRARRRASTRARLSALAHPVKGVRRMLGEWPAIRELLAERPLAATSLDRVVGQDRKLSLIRCELRSIKDTAHAHGAKVNDVLLAGIAGGLRALLSSRGEPVEGVLRIYVPVSLHQGVRAAARGNLIAQMVVELPIGVADPITRLRQIAAETKERKSRTRPSLGKVPHRGIAGRLFLKLVDRQRVNVSSADIPGPESPLYFAGARLLEVFPMVQLLGKNSLTVGAMSYAGRFNMMVVADRDAYPDLDVFVSGMQTELSALIGELPKSAVA
jgi:diacylglycerol O-acyltransferase